MKQTKTLNEIKSFKIYAGIIFCFWTVFVATILIWNIYNHKQELLYIAQDQAYSAFEKDLVYRRWAASHGGVYVPITEETPANPYLAHIDERDIETPSGRKLTLVNPAYMTRQVYQLSAEQYGLRGHITSLNPLRPENKPDGWEREALQSFMTNPSEITSVEQIQGKSYFRLIRPMVTEQRCLKCHSSQGYKIGDVRGGISVSVPLETLMQIANANILKSVYGFIILWFLGIAGILVALLDIYRRIQQSNLIQSQNVQLAKFPDENPSPVLRITQDGVVIYSNNAGEVLLDKWKCKVGNTIPEKWKNWIVRAFQCDSISTIHEEVINDKTFSLVIVPVRDAGYVNLYGRDITDNKLLLQQMGERIKELNCLYNIAATLQQRKNLDEIFLEVLGLIPSGWRYTEITKAKILIDGNEYTIDSFEETPWKLTSDITIKGKKHGTLEVYYLEQCPILDEGPFLKEERNLINNIASNLAETIMRNNMEHELKNIFHLSVDIIGIAGFDGKFKKINPAFSRLLGYTEEEILSTPFLEYVHPDDREATLIEVEAMYQGIKILNFRNRYLCKDGNYRWLEWNARPIIEEKVTYFVAHDITQRKQTEEVLEQTCRNLEQTNQELKEMQSQIIQSEKLASIGQLAAGVAHELNTPIGFVASNFQTLKGYMTKFIHLLNQYEDLRNTIPNGSKHDRMQLVEDLAKTRTKLKIDFLLEDIQELFNDSNEGLERVTNIVQNLRDFSRIDQADEHEMYNLNEGIESTLIVGRNAIKYDADVITDFGDIPAVHCHPGAINQVILNILVNAAQAIKHQERNEKGTIKVKTYTVESEIVCEISDDGPGIPEDKVSKIFDPFFTTKPVGKGTGLGLSVSYDIIVNKHHGHLKVDSQLGKGTTFTIKLPIKQSANNIVAEESYCGKH